MKPHKFEHIGVRVADGDRSIAFYTEVLGMTLLERRKFGEVELIFLELAGQQIELIAGDHEALDGRNPIDHFAFTVRDLDAAKAEVERLAPWVDFTEDLPLWDGLRCTFFKGPDGEKLELFERRD